MTEAQYQELKAKVERELPVRRALAGMLRVKLGDQTIPEFLSLIAACYPEQLHQAGVLVRPLLSEPRQGKARSEKT